MKFPPKITVLAVLSIVLGTGVCAYAYWAPTISLPAINPAIPGIRNAAWDLQELKQKKPVAAPDAKSVVQGLNERHLAFKLLQQSA